MTSNVQNQDLGISHRSEQLFWLLTPVCLCVCWHTGVFLFFPCDGSLPVYFIYVLLIAFHAFFKSCKLIFFFLLFSCNSPGSFFLVLERAPVTLPSSLLAPLWCPKPNPSTNLRSRQPCTPPRSGVPSAPGSHKWINPLNGVYSPVGACREGGMLPEG